MKQTLPRLRWPRRNRRGSALIFAFVVLLIMTLALAGMAACAVSALRLTRTRVNSNVAFNLAESGAERGILYLTQLSSPPTGTATINPFGTVSVTGAGTYTVTVIPDAANVSTSSIPHYTVQCVGVSNNRTETVQVYVQVGSFGRYAYFTDYEQSSIASGAIWFKQGDLIDGPAHSNNTSNTNFNINYSGSSTPIFRDMLNSVGSSITYSPGTPSSESAWGNIYLNGSRGYRLNATRVELPDSTTRQKEAAWGNTSGFPTSGTVHLPANGSTLRGGIYLNGDQSVTFALDTNNPAWQVINIQPSGSSTVTKITVKRDTNTTTMQVGSGSVTTYQGVPNGVLYSNGTITSLSGTLADNVVSGTDITAANAWTVATDVVNNENVTITGNLKYKTAPNKTQAWNTTANLRAATLGVVARNIIVSSTAPTDLSIHGVMLAGGRNTSDGSFYVANYSSKSVGDLHLIGGLIQKKRGPVGTFSGTTISSGYDKDYSYDPRMATSPPPFFPTTGTYERLSWLRTGAGYTGY